MLEGGNGCKEDHVKNDQLSNEISTMIHDLEVSEAQFREKELQWSQLKRCRLCTRGDRMHLNGVSLIFLNLLVLQYKVFVMNCLGK